MSTNATLDQKVVDYIGWSSAALEKAAKLEDKLTKAASLIPEAVQALVANGRIKPDQVKQAEAALRDPASIMELLIKVADHRTRDEADAEMRIGEGINKTASAHGDSNSMQSAHVGARVAPSGQVKQSDLALFRKLGLPAPQPG